MVKVRLGVWRAETVSTLKFAHRAKAVRNSAHVNEDADQRTLLRKYEQELRKLRAELQMRQREVVDKRHLLAVRASWQSCPEDIRACTGAVERWRWPDDALLIHLQKSALIGFGFQKV